MEEMISPQKIGQRINSATLELWKRIFSPMKDPVFHGFYERQQKSRALVTGTIRRANSDLIRVDPYYQMTGMRRYLEATKERGPFLP